MYLKTILLSMSTGVIIATMLFEFFNASLELMLSIALAMTVVALVFDAAINGGDDVDRVA